MELSELTACAAQQDEQRSLIHTLPPFPARNCSPDRKISLEFAACILNAGLDAAASSLQGRRYCSINFIHPAV